jgi:hypothetical protein
MGTAPSARPRPSRSPSISTAFLGVVGRGNSDRPLGAGWEAQHPPEGPPVLSHPTTCLSREPAVPAGNL